MLSAIRSSYPDFITLKLVNYGQYSEIEIHLPDNQIVLFSDPTSWIPWQISPNEALALTAECEAAGVDLAYFPEPGNPARYCPNCNAWHEPNDHIPDDEAIRDLPCDWWPVEADPDWVEDLDPDTPRVYRGEADITEAEAADLNGWLAEADDLETWLANFD